MKMSRIVAELERQDIEVTYENIAIFAVFVSSEGLVDRLKLDTDNRPSPADEFVWLEQIFK